MSEAEDLSGTNLNPYRLSGGIISLGCLSCSLLRECRGQTRVGGGWSCESRCDECDRNCDLVCLGKPKVLAKARMEVRSSFDWKDIGSVISPMGMPRYVPTLHHGYRRRVALATDWAAIPLTRVLRKLKSGEIEPVAETPGELRKKFGVHPGAKLLLLGIGEDEPIEYYWKWRTTRSLPKALSDLGWDAAVVPNYSLCVDDPRPQHLHNRKRSLICAEEWSRSGIPTVPYLSALTQGDFDYWREFLIAHPEVTTVAKEFQTGLGNFELGESVLDAIARIQDDIKRRLHVVAVGGAQYREGLHRRFESWTLIDSEPFMRTVKRRRGEKGLHRLRWKSAKDKRLDVLLRFNLSLYKWWLDQPTQKRDRPRKEQSIFRRPAQKNLYQLSLEL